MIQKYYKDTMVMTADIPYEERSIYTYKWYVNEVLVSTLYSYNYYFPKTGIYNVRLITTDKETGLQNITTKQISVIVPMRYFIESPAETNAEFYLLNPYSSVHSASRISSLIFYSNDGVSINVWDGTSSSVWSNEISGYGFSYYAVSDTYVYAFKYEFDSNSYTLLCKRSISADIGDDWIDVLTTAELITLGGNPEGGSRIYPLWLSVSADGKIYCSYVIDDYAYTYISIYGVDTSPTVLPVITHERAFYWAGPKQTIPAWFENVTETDPLFYYWPTGESSPTTLVLPSGNWYNDTRLYYSGGTWYLFGQDIDNDYQWYAYVKLSGGAWTDVTSILSDAGITDINWYCPLTDSKILIIQYETGWWFDGTTLEEIMVNAYNDELGQNQVTYNTRVAITLDNAEFRPDSSRLWELFDGSILCASVYEG